MNKNKGNKPILLQEYISELEGLYQTGNATEKSYRAALESLLREKAPQNIVILHEPKCETYGIPDFKLLRNDLAVSFVETKNINDNDLKGVKPRGHKEQFDRYRAALNTIVFTDYLTFHLYIDGALLCSATIGHTEGNRIVFDDDEQEVAKFEKIVQSLFEAKIQRITSPLRLADIMAGKAKLISDIIFKAMAESSTSDDKELLKKMDAIKRILVHDMDEKAFADFYSQIIIYGMFIARIYDNTPDTFSLMEASKLIPTYSPFLKKIFGYITLTELHPCVEWIVGDLVEIFRATDMTKVMKNYGKESGKKDPIVNFYEDFFKKLDPNQRKDSAAWFTPQPIVRYIVNAVDYILKSSFDLPDGLADNSFTADPCTGNAVHRVQILDPATGTGTFLVEVCDKIRESYKGQEGLWPEDVVKHIIPRLYGFEYLIAPYTLAHLKLSSALGLKDVANVPERLNIFLTNSLEESSTIPPLPFAEYISSEANAANAIKRDTPVMVILGNPPYKEKSANNSDWITAMMDDYKQEPGKKKTVITAKKTGKKTVKNTLEEKNPKGLNNDYCKFIRLGEHFVERNEEGVLAYISANTFLDASLFRGMRYDLLTKFDEIYILNLHGSLKRKEVNGDSHEECVFDIQVGVSINIFVRKKLTAGSLAHVFYKDVYGTKQEKFEYLDATPFSTNDFEELRPQAPLYSFCAYDSSAQDEYKQGFAVDKLIPNGVQGFTTDHDNVAIHSSKQSLLNIANDFVDKELSDETLRTKYNIKDGRDWQLSQAREKIQKSSQRERRITQVLYRPFDLRWTLFDTAFVTYPRPLIRDNVLNCENLVLCIGKQGNVIGNDEWSLAFISDLPTEKNVVYRGGIYLFPLYIYDGAFRHTNFDMKIVGEIERRVGLTMQDNADKKRDPDGFLPVDVMDYVYATLYSRTYRTRFHDFLQSGFPVIPFPKDKDQFFGLAGYGKQLRELHLMKSIKREDIMTSFPVYSKRFGNLVEKVRCKEEADGLCRVYINGEQYFDGIPADVYHYTICGYQMAEKFLNDKSRKGKRLTNDEIINYQKMIYAIRRTIDLQKDIDRVFARNTVY